MRRKWLPWTGGTAAIIIAGAVLLLVVFPGGASTANNALLEHVAGEADAGTATVLVSQDWGDGHLVLVGFERVGERVLGFGFAARDLRGWRVAAYTAEVVEPDDVVVGSLLVASSEGGTGQPPWSAAAGELIDDRVDRVEVTWEDGESTTGLRIGNAYLVAHEGTTTAVEATYLAEDGTEIATVPVSP
jgi:hypothetical protein